MEEAIELACDLVVIAWGGRFRPAAVPEPPVHAPRPRTAGG
jgi:hypothetical protein